MNKSKLKVLFVCMGNICRSPTAEGVFRKKVSETGLTDEIYIDSAGTHNYHPNSPPDSRSQIHAAKRGYDLSQIRARAIQEKDFEDFDLLITMDWDNRALLEERPNQHHKKIKGLTEFLLTTQANVIPDPYYGGEEGFEYVLDLVEEASEGLLQIATKRISQ